MAGRPRFRSALVTACGALALIGARAPVPAPAIDAVQVLAQHFGNDADWYRDRIPLFESSDPLLERVWYYRWQIVRAHQRDLGREGYITTEFLDDVSWQKEPYASLNDATGFHLSELRWLRDRRFADDYIAYMYQGGNDRHFTDYMADSVWSRYLADGDRDAALRHLGAMRLLWGQWDAQLDRSKGLYWIEPLLDATEYTISSIDASGGKDGFRGGDAFRPSINSYMFANARALAKLSALAGDPAGERFYAERAADLKQRVQRDLWSGTLDHFIDRYKVSNEHVRYWEPIRGRELVGYVPWAFDLPDDAPRFAAAWRHLTASTGFAGKAGLRTVEPSYQHYMRQYRYLGTAPECQWNGPIWPFQTTQVLQGMINLLDHYQQHIVDRGHFLSLLRQYARLHEQNGRLDLEEDYHPETGRPIVGLERSHHYFHSGFNDLIVTGVVGVRPRADDVLEINPLIPTAGGGDALRWFRMEGLPYHGRSVTISWDRDGTRYGIGKGLRVWVDGVLAASQRGLGRLELALPRRAPPAIDRAINHAVQLERGAFPRPGASANTDAEQMHDAVDGRTWFFPEAVNGWTIPQDRTSWYELDLGEARRLSRAELALFVANGAALPAGFHRWQYLNGQAWRDLPVAPVPAVPNGVTDVRWQPVTTRKVRVHFAAAPAAARLVELKLF